MKRTLAACAVGLLAALAPSFAGAQGTFPTRTVRFIVPFPGGGINDVLARIVGEKLQTSGGTRSSSRTKGAGGAIGAELVPVGGDGYTMLLSQPLASRAPTAALRSRRFVPNRGETFRRRDRAQTASEPLKD
jgi:tripartite-type tricarboxylate transporter receptor subunit TctC